MNAPPEPRQREPIVGRALHCYVRDRLRANLGSRSWTWLSEASGVPQSTLSNQLSKPKFSLEVIVRVAHALGIETASLLPPPSAVDSDGSPADDPFEELARIVEELRKRTRVGRGRPDMRNRKSAS